MTLKARIYLTLALLFATFSLSAQIYPVQLNVRLIPPYSVYLADYATNGQLQVLVLQRDLTEPSYSLRLSMEVQLGGSVILRTSQQFTPPPIVVAPGQPVLLNAEDLLPYLDPNNLDFFGYSRTRYEQTKALPEGAYTIRFTAYDYHRNEVAVSAPAQNFYYLAKAEPPMLSLPYSGQQLPAERGRPILFQWLPRNTGSLNSAMSTAYRLELFEIRPEGQNPQAVVQSARPIFSIETEQNQYLYTPADPELEPNMVYAWRVQAFDRDGRDAFVNRGYSEVFHFLYGTPADGSAALEPITDLAAVAISPYAAKAEWSSAGYDSFVLSYRKSEGDNEWFTTTTKDTSLTVAQLEENTRYEFRIQGLLEAREGPLSEVVELTTPTRIPHICGDPTTKPQQELGEPLADLPTGSLVRVGDFVLKVSEASGGSGTFTGKGQVYIPFLEGLSVAVTFKNVYINTALELTKGQVIAESMPLDQWIADKLQKQGIVQKQQPVGDVDVNFPINSPKDIKVLTPDGKPYVAPTDTTATNQPIPVKLAIKDAQGVEHTYDVADLPATVSDTKGNVYQVDRDGKVSQLAKGGDPIAREDLENLNLTNARVDFSGASSYAFARLNEDYTGDFRDAFEVLTNHGGSDSYAVPFQLLEAGKSVEVQAMLTLNNQKLDTAKLSFVTGANLRLVPKSIMHDGNGRYTYTLVLPAVSARDGLEIFAVMTPAEGQHYSIGKLTALAYEHKTHKLVLVPVGKAKGKTDQLTESVVRGLKDAYAPLAIDFSVTQDNSFGIADSEWDSNSDGQLQVSGSGAFATLTGEMKLLNSAYSQTTGYDPQTAYLFVLERADSANVAGDMPRGKQFGYLFLSGIKAGDAGRLAAHELGHGLFTLRHSWNYCKSPDQLYENLMSYSNGTALTKYQWDMAHNPETALDMWKSDEEGMFPKTTSHAEDIARFISLYGCAVTTNGSFDFYKPGSISDGVLMDNVTLPGGETVHVRIIMKEALYDYKPVKNGYAIDGEELIFRGFKISASKVTINQFVSYLQGDRIDHIAEQQASKISRLLVSDKSAAYDLLYQSSPCILEKLPLADKLAVLDDFGSTFYLIDKKDHIVVSLLQSMLENVDEARKLYDWLREHPEQLISLYNGVDDEQTRERFIQCLNQCVALYWSDRTIDEDVSSEKYFIFDSNKKTFIKTGDGYKGLLSLTQVQAGVRNTNQQLGVNPMEPVGVWLTDSWSDRKGVNDVLVYLPAISLKYIVEDKDASDRGEFLGAAGQLASFAIGSGMLVKGGTWIIRIAGAAEMANAAVTFTIQTEAIKQKLQQSKEGQEFLRLWPKISLITDVATLTTFVAVTQKSVAVIDELSSAERQVVNAQVDRANRVIKLTKQADGIPFINGYTKEKVLALTTKPNPSIYLDPVYMKKHLNLFQEEVSCLTFESGINTFGQIGRIDGLFVIPKREMDELLRRSGGNISLIEAELGIPTGEWGKRLTNAISPDKLIRIDIKKAYYKNLRMSTGNEVGANSLWQPGGYTPNGIPEAVIDAVPTSNISTYTKSIIVK